MAKWPDWWGWEIELSSHLLKRMVDRRFSEVDLRLMMEHATEFREGEEEGRWVLETVHDSALWEVVVEPDTVERMLVVITAYPVEEL